MRMLTKSRGAIQISREDYLEIANNYKHVFSLVPEGAIPRLIGNPASGLYTVEYETVEHENE